MSSVTTDALPFGLMLAHTPSAGMPTCFAMARAVISPSPVIMLTSMPMFCSARIACALEAFGASCSDTARTGSGRFVLLAIAQ